MLWLSWLIVGFLYNLLNCKVYCEIVIKKNFKLNFRIFFICFIFALLNCYSIYYNTYLRPLFIHLCYVIIVFFCYRESLIKAILSVILLAIISVISELIVSVIYYIFMNGNPSSVSNNFLSVIISNLAIMTMIYLIISMKIPKRIFSYIVKWYKEQNKLNIILISVTFLLTLALLMYQIFSKNLSYNNLIVYIIFIISSIIFVLNLFKENSEKSYISAEYNNLVEYVKKYENMIDQKSKEQHEYRNQLIIIRDKISKTNKKAIEYIDNILNIPIENNSEWLRKIKSIPSGGLKGLYYYKIEEMLANDINLYINVSDKLKDKNIWNCCEKNMYDITLIIGVYIDNAIQAAKISKEKYIVLDIDYDNESIVFSFSNTYFGTIDLNKLDDIKYTTKGIGHGYGLVIVKETLEKNDSLNQYREINGKYYVQKLVVKAN